MLAVEDPLSLFRDAIRSPETLDKYERCLKRFFLHVGADSKSFVVKAREDPSWVKGVVLEYARFLRRRCEAGEVGAFTAHNYLKPVRLFCEMNDVLINWKKVTRLLPAGRRYAQDRAPTVEEIRLLAGEGDPRLKCGVLVMVSGGIRVGAWEYLLWGHIQPVERDDVIVAAKVTVYAGEPEEYFTFITPEAYQAVKEYMAFRELHGETIGPESPVLRNQFEATVKGSRGLASVPKPLKVAGLRHLVDRALWKYGIRKEKRRRHDFQVDHGFRKWFKTRAEQVMKPIHVEILMGHSVGISDSYYRPREQEILDDYLKAVPLLTITSGAVERSELEKKREEERQQFLAKLEELSQRLKRLEEQP